MISFSTIIFKVNAKKRIAEAASRFRVLQDDMKKKGQVLPEGDGVLIFDEVKVTARLLWNSRSQ